MYVNFIYAFFGNVKFLINATCLFSNVECDMAAESMEFYMLESTVRGHHVYKVTWTPVVGQVLHVQSNTYDRFAVATHLNDVVVGRMPREIPRIAWHFL